MRENRARAAARRQGLSLHKSRARDPRAVGYQGWMISDETNMVVAGELGTPWALSLDQVEAYLDEAP